MKKSVIEKIESFELSYGYYGGNKKLDGITIKIQGDEGLICVGYDLYNYQASQYLGEKAIEKWRWNKGFNIAEKLYDKLISICPDKEIKNV